MVMSRNRAKAANLAEVMRFSIAPSAALRVVGLEGPRRYLNSLRWNEIYSRTSLVSTRATHAVSARTLHDTGGRGTSRRPPRTRPSARCRVWRLPEGFADGLHDGF